MERNLHITGKGNIAVTPDLVILAFSAKAFASEYAAAIQALNHKVEALRVAIEREGIPRQDFNPDDIKLTKHVTVTWRIE